MHDATSSPPQTPARSSRTTSANECPLSPRLARRTANTSMSAIHASASVTVLSIVSPPALDTLKRVSTAARLDQVASTSSSGCTSPRPRSSTCNAAPHSALLVSMESRKRETRIRSQSYLPSSPIPIPGSLHVEPPTPTVSPQERPCSRFRTRTKTAPECLPSAGGLNIVGLEEDEEDEKTAYSLALEITRSRAPSPAGPHFRTHSSPYNPPPLQSLVASPVSSLTQRRGYHHSPLTIPPPRFDHDGSVSPSPSSPSSIFSSSSSSAPGAQSTESLLLSSSESSVSSVSFVGPKSPLSPSAVASRLIPKSHSPSRHSTAHSRFAHSNPTSPLTRAFQDEGGAATVRAKGAGHHHHRARLDEFGMRRTQTGVPDASTARKRANSALRQPKSLASPHLGSTTTVKRRHAHHPPKSAPIRTPSPLSPKTPTSSSVNGGPSSSASWWSLAGLLGPTSEPPKQAPQQEDDEDFQF